MRGKLSVMPREAGIQTGLINLNSGLRRNDDMRVVHLASPLASE
jgi:hypothetical protein